MLLLHVALAEHCARARNSIPHDEKVGSMGPAVSSLPKKREEEEEEEECGESYLNVMLCVLAVSAFTARGGGGGGAEHK